VARVHSVSQSRKITSFAGQEVRLRVRQHLSLERQTVTVRKPSLPAVGLPCRTARLTDRVGVGAVGPGHKADGGES
jgi:hypothetical protein